MSEPSNVNKSGLEFRIESELNDLQRRSRRRFLRRIESASAPEVAIDGERFLLFCSNNYLGLADHPALKRASGEAVERYGCGSGASRLVSGTLNLHLELERSLAEFVEKPAALLYNSGYQANIGVITALTDSQTVIYSDQLNHASIIDGIRLSRAKKRIYRHADPEHLARLLRDHPADHKALIVTESLFSQDGDRAPLARLVELARRHQATICVDEAHAFGTLGERGQGLVHQSGLSEEVDLLIGTLGKAFGSFGAVVACSAAVRDYLINRSRSFVFTTALPPAVVAAGLAALELVRTGELQRLLRSRVVRLYAALSASGRRCPAEFSPILPIILGDDRQTMSVCESLWSDGIYLQGIRPPTVPEGTARLRLTLMATHTDQQIDRLAERLDDVLEPGLPLGSKCLDGN